MEGRERCDWQRIYKVAANNEEESFQEKNELSDSTYQAKKVVCPLGLDVEKIHPCINDCILYRGAQYENLKACPVCTALRYKIRRDDPGDVEGERPRKRVPAKVMWYVIRLQRIYNFWCSMLILCQLLHVFPLLYNIFIRFLGLTYWQDVTVPVACFLLFLVSEKLFWKYSRNWTPRRQKSLFFQHVHGVRRRPEVWSLGHVWVA